jgi:hypothetical protein
MRRSLLCWAFFTLLSCGFSGLPEKSAGGSSELEASVENQVILAHEGLLLGAVVRQGEVVWKPTHCVSSAPSLFVSDDASASFVLTFADGSTRSVDAEVMAVADEDEYSVLAAVAESRSPVSVALVRDGAVLSKALAVARPQATQTRVRVVGQRAEVEWPGEWPYAAVTHVAEGQERTTLTLDAQGGRALLDLGQLVGGRFEVSLSTGVDAVLAAR